MPRRDMALPAISNVQTHDEPIEALLRIVVERRIIKSYVKYVTGPASTAVPL